MAVALRTPRTVSTAGVTVEAGFEALKDSGIAPVTNLAAHSNSNGCSSVIDAVDVVCPSVDEDTSSVTGENLADVDWKGMIKNVIVTRRFRDATSVWSKAKWLLPLVNATRSSADAS
jgi:hypothetical protein